MPREKTLRSARIICAALGVLRLWSIRRDYRSVQSGRCKVLFAVRPGGDRLTECIKTHFQEFVEPCKPALVRIAPVRESCGTDIRKQCRAVNPSAGRVLLCVKKHYTALSEARRTRKAAGGLGAMSYQMARCSAV